MNLPFLTVENLCKYYPQKTVGSKVKNNDAVFKAVENVSFTIPKGKTLGLVGESGCGKTTTARSILRAIRPTSGKILLSDNGTTIDLASIHEKELLPLRKKIQMIFQDPFSSLNPRMTVRDIVAEPLLIHKMATNKTCDAIVVEILAKVGLKPEHRWRYPHAFSGGQRQRIGIARALVMRPSFIVADEPVSALDVSVQAQIINLLIDLQHEFNLTYLFIGHDLSVVQHISDYVAVMFNGRIIEYASSQELFDNPLHPYTQLLLASSPSPDPDMVLGKQLEIALAMNKELSDRGCSLSLRCPYATGECRENEPLLQPIDGEHLVACFNCGKNGLLETQMMIIDTN